MGLICAVSGHSHSADVVSNGGYQFSTCTRCGIDLVQSGDERWIAPPKGYRIVKRPRPRAAVEVEQAAPSEPAAEHPVPVKEKRKSEDRRSGKLDTRPPSLRTIDRRRSDRRNGSGNFRANRRKGLVAE